MAEKLSITSADHKDEDLGHVEPRLITAVGYGICDVEMGKNMDRMSRISLMHANTSQVKCAFGRRCSIDPATVIPITFRTVPIAMDEIEDQPRAEVARTNIDTADELNDLHWHTLSINEAEAQLSTLLVQGLSAEQVDMKAQEFGQNVHSEPRSDCIFRMFGFIFGGFGSVVLIGGMLATITYKPLANPNLDRRNLALGIVLYAAFAIQILFNVWQDWLAAKLMGSISGMLPDDSSVIRDGHHSELLVVDLIPGDISNLKSGIKLSADIRLTEVC